MSQGLGPHQSQSKEWNELMTVDRRNSYPHYPPSVLSSESLLSLSLAHQGRAYTRTRRERSITKNGKWRESSMGKLAISLRWASRHFRSRCRASLLLLRGCSVSQASNTTSAAHAAAQLLLHLRLSPPLAPLRLSLCVCVSLTRTSHPASPVFLSLSVCGPLPRPSSH